MLCKNKITVFDGAIGTQLYERGFYINRPFEELNIASPKDVYALHMAYIDAGADVLTTNTFSITRPQLRKFGLEEKQGDFLKAGLEVANKAKSNAQEAKIVLSIGPLGELLEPLGSMSMEEAKGYFAEVGRSAEEQSGFDGYFLETFSNLEELNCAIAGIASVSRRPIIASITANSTQKKFLDQFASRFGATPLLLGLGLNCSEGPAELLKCLNLILPQVSLPVVVRPNAGLPRQINGRYFYMTSPDYLGKFAKRFVEAGAMGVGGCCGTGPEHIKAIRAAVGMVGSQKKALVNFMTGDSDKTLSPMIPIEKRYASKVGQALQRKEKILSIEILPPKGPDIDVFVEKLRKAEKRGVHFVNVPDGARASARMSSLHIASYVAHRTDINLTILPHLTCRDRNLIGLQSDLVGAYVNGVSDILLVTGDPPKLGNNKEATGIYDVDSIGLTYIVASLNRGELPNGDDLGGCTNFGIGVAANPTALNLETERERWKYKCEMGADFAVTQPIFDSSAFLNWLDKTSFCKRPHLVGIWPLVSYRNAEFLANEVPGIKIPSWILAEMEKAKDDPVDAVKRGHEIARRVMEELEKVCEGFCISAPLGKVEIALELCS